MEKKKNSPQSEGKTPRLVFLISFLILCFAALWLYLYTTPAGVGLTNDSSAYLGGARSILRGEGYVRFSGDRLPRPITQFPPLYSIAIAGIAKIFLTDVFRSAWILNLICYLMNLILFSLLIQKFTKNIRMGILAGIVYLCCGPILQAHVYGLSEAFSLIFMLSALWMLFDFSEKKRSFPSWLFLGLWIGLLTLVRYAGASILVTAILFCLVSAADMRKRLSRIGGMLLGFLIPFGGWWLRNSQYNESAVNRSLSIHLPGNDVINEGIRTLTEFFIPEAFGIVQKAIRFWKILWIILLLLLFVWLLRQFIAYLTRKKQELSGIFLFALAAGIYLLVLIGVSVFIDGSTVFDNRMLLPFFICIAGLILSTVGYLIRQKKISSVFGILLIIVFSVFLFEDESDLIKTFHKDGQGFAGSVWTESETAQAAEKLPQGKTFYSNRQTYLWLMQDMPAYILPILRDAALQQDNEDFEKEKEQMQQEIKNGEAYAIVFNYQDMLQDSSDKEWLDSLFEGVPIYGSYADGVIFGIKN